MWTRIKKIIVWTLCIMGLLLILLIVLAAVIPDENKEVSSAPKEAVSGSGPTPAKIEPTAPTYKAEIKQYNEYKEKKVSSVREISTKLAKEISTGFAVENQIPPEFFDTFYRCMGDLARTKSAELPVQTILAWCLDSYKQNPEEFKKSQSSYSFYDFINQFSKWDGSHPPSVEVIKREMHDPDSFKHLSTTFRFIRDKENKIEAWITTKFTGTNGFGGRVQGAIQTKINPDTGQVLEVKEVQ